MRAFEINNSQFQFKKERNNEINVFFLGLKLLFVKQRRTEQCVFKINNNFSVYNFLNNSVFSASNNSFNQMNSIFF